MSLPKDNIKESPSPIISWRRRQRPGPVGQDAMPEADKDLNDAAKILEMLEEGTLSINMTPNENPKEKLILTGKERLSFEEETELAYRVQHYGDIDARNCLVMANIGLVHLVANQYARPMVRYEDLVQEGTMGLIRATETFETDRGVRFSTYSVYWIRAKIQRLLQKVEKDDIPAIVGAELTPDHNGKKRRPRAKKLSLERSQEEEDSRSLSEMLPAEEKDPEKRALEQERNLVIREVLKGIASELHDDRLLAIIEKRLLSEEPQTLTQVGIKLNLSREGARLLEAKVLRMARLRLKKWQSKTAQ